MNLISLFKFLKKKRIYIDQNEFIIQYKSHPDYPTMLAINDTLNFFGVQNSVYNVPFSHVEELPLQFLTVMGEKNQFLTLITRSENRYTFNDDKGKKKVYNKKELSTSWQNIVILIEGQNDLHVDNNIKNKKLKKLLTYTLPLIALLTVLTLKNELSINLLVFYFLSLIGIWISILTNKGLFNVDDSFVQKMCQTSKKMNCETVINSDKWKIFKYLKYNELSVIFFGIQLVGIMTMALSNNLNEYFLIQNYLLILSLPLILLSIYYQLFIEKALCLLCLSIIGVMSIQWVFIQYIFKSNFKQLEPKHLYSYALIVFLVTIFWFNISSLLKTENNLILDKIRANKFVRNYDLFKKLLVDKDPVELNDIPLNLKTSSSKIQLTLITNPFCNACAFAHKHLEEIITNHNVSLNMIFNYEVDNREKLNDNDLIIKDLVSYSSSETSFLTALKSWFENGVIDSSKIEAKKKEIINTNELFNRINSQRDWCLKNEVHFTPTLYINGYLYPNNYNISDLQFFIRELSEDSEIKDHYKQIKTSKYENK